MQQQQQQQQQQRPLPRLRRLLHRGHSRGRRQLRALTPAPYNYKTDCAGAQKLFYVGFVLSSIASVVFLISFVFNSGGSGGSTGQEVADVNADGNSTLLVRPVTVNRRRELGLFETLALLCSAFGLCLIAGVFLCGLYVTRRRKDIDEERLLARGGGGGCWDGDDDDDGATETTETPGGDLSSYSISSSAGTAAQVDGRCVECGCRRSANHQVGDEPTAELDDEEFDDEEDDENDDEEEAACATGKLNSAELAGQPSVHFQAAAERLVRRALNSGVPRRLRRCTCGQISTVSRLSDRRAETAAAGQIGASAAAREGSSAPASVHTTDQSIAFF